MKQVQAIRAAVRTMPKRLKRAESFLGIHYDFHAGPDCTEIGKNTTRAMIENIIDQVRPDYLQIDCKGHPGLSSYPTKVGHQAPGIVGAITGRAIYEGTLDVAEAQAFCDAYKA